MKSIPTVSGKNDLEERTLCFSCDMIDFVRTLPHSVVGNVIGGQVLRSGTSIGANYREGNRAVSRADFVNKIGTCEKESSETDYWLEICRRKRLGDNQLCSSLGAESRELLAIFTTIGRKAKTFESEKRK